MGRSHATTSVLSDAAGPAAEDVQFYRTMLHELIELGVELARDVCRQAKAAPAPERPQADVAVMFERVSRAVRRTIALAQRLGEPVARDTRPEAARQMARRRVIRQVEDRIQFEPDRPGHRECLRSELYERMDAPELEEELDLRPAAEIIAEICRDLGIERGRMWPRRTPADIAALCARAARPRDAVAAVPPAQDETDPAVERFFRRAWPDGAG